MPSKIKVFQGFGLVNESAKLDRSVLTGKGVRIVPLRQKHPSALQFGLHAQGKRPSRSSAPSLVAIKEDKDLTGETAQEPELLDSQRGAQYSHGLGLTVLDQREEVEIALDQHSPTAALDHIFGLG